MGQRTAEKLIDYDLGVHDMAEAESTTSRTCWSTSPSVGEGIAPLLAGIGDAEGMEAVGGWIIDCATVEELLSQFGNEGGNA